MKHYYLAADDLMRVMNAHGASEPEIHGVFGRGAAFVVEGTSYHLSHDGQSYQTEGYDPSLDRHGGNPWNPRKSPVVSRGNITLGVYVVI